MMVAVWWSMVMRRAQLEVIKKHELDPQIISWDHDFCIDIFTFAYLFCNSDTLSRARTPPGQWFVHLPIRYIEMQHLFSQVFFVWSHFEAIMSVVERKDLLDNTFSEQLEAFET